MRHPQRLAVLVTLPLAPVTMTFFGCVTDDGVDDDVFAQAQAESTPSSPPRAAK